MINVYKRNWQFISTTVQSTISACFLFLCIVLPFFFLYKLRKNYENLDKEENKEKFGALYKDLAYNDERKGKSVFL